MPTRQWFISHREEILGQAQVDLMLPELEAKTRRSRGAQTKRGPGRYIRIYVRV